MKTSFINSLDRGTEMKRKCRRPVGKKCEFLITACCHLYCYVFHNMETPEYFINGTTISLIWRRTAALLWQGRHSLTECVTACEWEQMLLWFQCEATFQERNTHKHKQTLLQSVTSRGKKPQFHSGLISPQLLTGDI